MSFVFFFASRRRHTRCALVTGVQTCALPILIARDDSQLIPRASCRAATAARDAERVGIGWYEGQDFGTADALLDSQAVAGQRLAADDVAQVVGEMLERRETAGLGVEMRKIEAQAETLLAAVLAHAAVQHALKTACPPETGSASSRDREWPKISNT